MYMYMTVKRKGRFFSCRLFTHSFISPSYTSLVFVTCTKVRCCRTSEPARALLSPPYTATFPPVASVTVRRRCVSDLSSSLIFLPVCCTSCTGFTITVLCNDDSKVVLFFRKFSIEGFNFNLKILYQYSVCLTSWRLDATKTTQLLFSGSSKKCRLVSTTKLDRFQILYHVDTHP